jgi:hypothetical protein
VKRLNGMDALLLYSETSNVHTHTLKIAILDVGDRGSVPGFDDFRKALEGRLHLLEPRRPSRGNDSRPCTSHRNQRFPIGRAALISRPVTSGSQRGQRPRSVADASCIRGSLTGFVPVAPARRLFVQPDEGADIHSARYIRTSIWFNRTLLLVSGRQAVLYIAQHGLYARIEPSSLEARERRVRCQFPRQGKVVVGPEHAEGRSGGSASART